MVGRGTLRIGLIVAAAGIALGASGCFAPSPPAAANLSVTPLSVNFGSLAPPYNPMPILPVTVTNTGGHTASNVVVHGVGVYSVPSTTCSSLAPGQSCTADIQFCPSAPGPDLNTLIVTGQDAATGAALQGSTILTGTGT